MTMVQTRARQIAELEGFEIVVLRDSVPIDPRANGLLNGRYPFEKKMRHSMSVADFRERFERTYPGFSCQVLNDDGTVAEGQTHLRTVRETYEE
jgi:hypothetical protein